MAPHIASHDSSPLWLAVYLPAFPLEVFSQSEDAPEPIVVVEGGASPRIVTCTVAATRAGVAIGMKLSAALAFSPQLQALKRDTAQEAAALEGLAAWSSAFTSFTSLVGGEGLLLEIGGSLRFFGGAEYLWAQVDGGLRELGYRPYLAIAPTPLGAWLLARAGKAVRVFKQQELKHALASIPVTDLGLPAETAGALRGVGTRCFGDCLDLPQKELARRLGSELVTFFRHALGRQPDPRIRYRPPELFQRCLPLAAEVWDVETLLFALHRLLAEMEGLLRARSEGVTCLLIRLFHHRQVPTQIRIRLTEPSRDKRHLRELLRVRLEQMELSAAVEEVALCAEETRQLGAHTSDLFGEKLSPQQDWQVLVDRLHARLGEGAVCGLGLVEDHRPERAWCTAPPGLETKISDPDFGPARPLWLLETPRGLKVQSKLPEYRGALVMVSGPERIENGWWDGEDVTRDYYVAENPAGERFWIYRERRGERRWFLHGVFA